MIICMLSILLMNEFKNDFPETSYEITAAAVNVYNPYGMTQIQ